MLSSCAESKFILYKKGEVLPLLYAEYNAKKPAADFVQLFSKFESQLEVTPTTPPLNKAAINLVVNPTTTGFSLRQEGNHLTITGASITALRKGIRHFFATYTNVNQFNAQKTAIEQQTISIPPNLKYQSNVSLSYIEPYFNENFNEEFRLWNNTNTLEESWGLWGHNIGKIIKVTPAMLAIVNEKINDEQLNFSSKALEIALTAAIGEKLAAEPQANKFMVMPYDNGLVCLCEACVALGNTKTNASPAVYALIDKLAAKFPKVSFFSTAYVTTETPPTRHVKPNVGVMISTMSFPKGVVLEASNKVGIIRDKFADWKKVTDNIYLWDYAINFDNYFDFYPTVSIAQKNLSFYLNNGVKGVFMHGSDEGSFVAFGDLKTYLYAQLYNNPDVDLKSNVQRFFANKYPAIAKEIAEYYLHIEEIALKSNKTIDIYGGIKQSVNKYLNQEEVTKLLSELLLKKKQETVVDKNSSILLMSLLFQNLELIRSNGLTENGYATYQNSEFILKPEIYTWLTHLKRLSVLNKVDIYNESNFSLANYLINWNSRILAKPYTNLFFKKSFNVISKLDEDYNDPSKINDGAIGFEDYYNNWLLITAPSFDLETEALGLEKSTLIQIDFLYDKRHKIFPPEKITVSVGSRSYEKSISNTEMGDERGFFTVSIPIKVQPTDKQINLSIKRQQQSEKRLMAFDEIIFK